MSRLLWALLLGLLATFAVSVAAARVEEDFEDDDASFLSTWEADEEDDDDLEEVDEGEGDADEPEEEDEEQEEDDDEQEEDEDNDAGEEEDAEDDSEAVEEEADEEETATEEADEGEAGAIQESAEGAEADVEADDTVFAEAGAEADAPTIPAPPPPNETPVTHAPQPTGAPTPPAPAPVLPNNNVGAENFKRGASLIPVYDNPPMAKTDAAEIRAVMGRGGWGPAKVVPKLSLTPCMTDPCPPAAGQQATPAQQRAVDLTHSINNAFANKRVVTPNSWVTPVHRGGENASPAGPSIRQDGSSMYTQVPANYDAHCRSPPCPEK